MSFSETYNCVPLTDEMAVQRSRRCRTGYTHNKKPGIMLYFPSSRCLTSPDLSEEAETYTLDQCWMEFILNFNTHQGCLRTAWKPTACIRMQIAIWPRRGVKTFRETRFAVGRFRQSTGNGPVQPTIYVSVASLPCWIGFQLTEDGNGENQDQINEQKLWRTSVEGWSRLRCSTNLKVS